ncbi:hypothetical protein H2201_005445 [Coniosporium apollinis]|uniref:DUF676 domain-containing protein n=1 Tax=Coniosporium apollinis TaxID=61459 RepID=A0ABQ9NS99_9PEZI|nr:hypothetical protein H2201_005445 [Coniosporium apollinis]
MDHLVGGVIRSVGDVVDGTVHTAGAVVGGAAHAVGRLVNDPLGSVVEGAKLGATAIPKRLVDWLGHENSIIDSATAIFKKANDEPVRKLVETVLQRSPTLISPELLLETVKELTVAVLKAVITKVGQLQIIKDGISSNQLNKATLGIVQSNGADLARFFVDLVECAKCYASADSLDGAATQNHPHRQDNEFDFAEAMNRHAAICQVQRLAKSIIFMLERITVRTTFDQIMMSEKTTLPSDILELRTTIKVTPARQSAGPALPEDEPEEAQRLPNEKWLFVNGIAGERYWLHLACKKLAMSYVREIEGVFNRGDGILWDLIECAGERDAEGKGRAGSQKELIQRTKSSRIAQKTLKEQLITALEDLGPTHVVMIAHSQGCLLLSLALESLLNDLVGTGDVKIRKTMLSRLCVFTFGNPSVDWKLEMDEGHSIEPLENSDQARKDLTYLSSHVLRTEHFANEKDFVARLGVLNEKKPPDSGYDYIFINKGKDWIGHLFGTQYSLDPNDYTEANGQISWLLACADAIPMRRE